MVPIINYNDPVSDEEVRKMELASRRAEGEDVVECVDNDETAEVVAKLVGAKHLILLTSMTASIWTVTIPPRWSGWSPAAPWTRCAKR